MKTIILPGWMQSDKEWKALIEKFEDVNLINLPGFGVEPLVNSDWTVKDYSRWVLEKIEQEYPNEQICLIGHSFGGRIATEIASKNPKWLKKIILYASPVIYRPSNRVRLTKRIASLTPKFIKRKIHFTGSDDYENAKGTEMQQIYQNTITYDQGSMLREIKIPTIILWGEQDKEVPLTIAKEINRLIKDSELVVIPNAGHNMHINQTNILYGKLKNIIY